MTTRDPSDDDLTPLDALVLLDPNKPVGARAVRLALRLLAARGVIRTAEPRRGIERWTGTRLCVGIPSAALPSALAAVADALRRDAVDEVTLAPTECVARLQRAFRYDYAHYLRDHLRLPLVARGLLEVHEYRQLGIFTRRRYHYTDAGLRARARVERTTARLGEVPALLATAPRQAARVAAVAGALVLLEDALRPHHAALATALRDYGASTDAGALEDDVATLLDDEERRLGWMDGIDALQTVDWGDVMNAVDGVADAFDAGGGDGGVDGGSSDGGSGSD
jgi:hypothetical protein